ncbi:hypothetical protein GCM10010392_68870 [Streptomyces clavifer]|nr:hypothetical protein GCM10010392_68870 [Streptomyces clavifer]
MNENYNFVDLSNNNRYFQYTPIITHGITRGSTNLVMVLHVETP